MIDHDKAGRRRSRQAGRARDRRQHDRHLLDRQRAAHEHVAGWRHDAVPEREEHELGGRVPRPRADPLARARSRPATVSNEIVQHHDWLPTFLAAAGEPDIVEKLKAGHAIGDTTYKVHIDGYDLLPYLTGEVDKSPRPGLVYFSDDGDVLALRFDNWKVVFMEQRVAGNAADLGRAVRRAPRAEAVQPAHRPVRARRRHVEHLLGLVPRQRLPRPGGHGARDRSSSRRSRSSRRGRRRRASRSTRWSRSSRPRSRPGQ